MTVLNARVLPNPESKSAAHEQSLKVRELSTKGQLKKSGLEWGRIEHTVIKDSTHDAPVTSGHPPYFGTLEVDLGPINGEGAALRFVVQRHEGRQTGMILGRRESNHLLGIVEVGFTRAKA